MGKAENEKKEGDNAGNVVDLDENKEIEHTGSETHRKNSPKKKADSEGMQEEESSAQQISQSQ